MHRLRGSGVPQQGGGEDRCRDRHDARPEGRELHADQARTAGMMIQWLVDPDTAPSADDLTNGLRAVLEDRD
ncbi:hypothetical protein [Streptomyces sp. NPDC096193]|uniref:hypothetical protein n=1 Tax=Streptomyces sp. NPDC096193 TaxID=3155821 RepID=UPI00332EC697